MHAVGLHSALAIKRQRMRRDEQRRARERRYSSQSGESGLTSPRASTASLDKHSRHQRKVHKNHSAQGIVDSKVVTSIGMLHIGVVFLVLGGFLLVSGLLPSDYSSLSYKVSNKWWNELIAIGLLSTVIGCFLIILNRIIAKREENDLEQYVQRQLTRSKSGHRLERDLETGGLTTKHAKRVKQLKIKENDENNIETGNHISQTSPQLSYFSLAVQQNDSSNIPGLVLEQITEEDISEKLDISINNCNPMASIKSKIFNPSLNFNNSYNNHPLCTELCES